jgi:hypothetical protein
MEEGTVESGSFSRSSSFVSAHHNKKGVESILFSSLCLFLEDDTFLISMNSGREGSRSGWHWLESAMVRPPRAGAWLSGHPPGTATAFSSYFPWIQHYYAFHSLSHRCGSGIPFLRILFSWCNEARDASYTFCYVDRTHYKSWINFSQHASNSRYHHYMLWHHPIDHIFMSWTNFL